MIIIIIIIVFIVGGHLRSEPGAAHVLLGAAQEDRRSARLLY